MVDSQRSAVYAAESSVRDMVDRGADVDFHGTVLAIEPDRRFGQVTDVPRYLDWVRAHDWGYPDVPAPTVRLRRGAAKAAWEAPGVIALPDAAWARRELVVLHEYTHHALWHTLGPAELGHGPTFCRHFAELVRQAVGPSVGLLLTDAFHTAGLLGPAR